MRLIQAGPLSRTWLLDDGTAHEQRAVMYGVELGVSLDAEPVDIAIAISKAKIKLIERIQAVGGEFASQASFRTDGKTMIVERAYFEPMPKEGDK